MINRISTLISVLSLIPAALLLLFGVREYRAGGSVAWVGFGALLILSGVVVLIRDIRALRRTQARTT
ncbi:hypothetical protein [Streptomyces hypolithicus]